MAKPDKKIHSQDNSGKKSAIKVVCDNRHARHQFEILEVFQAGIELLGTEVKSLRQGRVNLKDSFAKIETGQLWLYNCHIAAYDHGNRFNHDPLRPRRLLIHRKDIIKLKIQIKEKGLTIVPLRFYFKNNWAKVDLAISRGKHLYDKRQALANAESKRKLDRLVKLQQK